MKYKINDAGKHIEENDPRPEFLAMEPFCRGLGLDIGCGTNRLSPTVLSIDNYPHLDADLIWDCWKPEGTGYVFNPYPFRDCVFDFVFASHLLEDFPRQQIFQVFNEWMRLVKVGGHLIILVPDMEGGRYPDWDEKFNEEDEEVKSGKRKLGELKGNPSHSITMGITLLNEMAAAYESIEHNALEIVQVDTIPHNTMTLDFVVRKFDGTSALSEKIAPASS